MAQVTSGFCSLKDIGGGILWEIDNINRHREDSTCEECSQDAGSRSALSQNLSSVALSMT